MLDAVEHRARGDLRREHLRSRRTASPPRWRPAPPESGISPYDSVRNGKRVSNTSTGVLRQLPWTWFCALCPSPSSAAAPAARLEVVVRVRLAVSGWMPPKRKLHAVAPSAAITRSGMASASAPSSMPTSFGCVSVLPPTDGPGKRTFTTEPGGAIVVMQPYEPGVARDLGAAHLEERVARGRHGHAVGRVHRPARLRVGARPVDDRAVAVDDQPHAHRHRLARVAVALHHVLEGVLAVGDRLDAAAHQPLAVREQLVPHGERERRALAVEQRLQPAVGQLERADHRVQVAPARTRRAVVGEDDLPDVLDRLARTHELHRWEAQALLVDLRRRRGERADRDRADLRHVPDRGREGDELAAVEDGADSRCSGMWQPPRNGSLCSTTSPGSNASVPSSASTQRTVSPIAPRCAGLKRPCAIIRPRRSNSAHERSRDSLKMGE